MMNDYEAEHKKEMDEVRLKIDLVLSKGFDCHVCSSTTFAYNSQGLIFCEECAITYHVDMLVDIYNK